MHGHSSTPVWRLIARLYSGISRECLDHVITTASGPTRWSLESQGCDGPDRRLQGIDTSRSLNLDESVTQLKDHAMAFDLEPIAKRFVSPPLRPR